MAGIKRFGQGSTSPDGSTGPGFAAPGTTLATKTQGGHDSNPLVGANVVSFPVAFSSPPNVTANINQQAAGAWVVPVYNITATGFTYETRIASSGGSSSGNPIQWVAVGT